MVILLQYTQRSLLVTALESNQVSVNLSKYFPTGLPCLKNVVVSTLLFSNLVIFVSWYGLQLSLVADGLIITLHLTHNANYMYYHNYYCCCFYQYYYYYCGCCCSV